MDTARIAAPCRLEHGEIIDDRYKIVRWIAEGGMGEVYEAWHLSLNKTIALKTVRADVADPNAEERLRREGRIGASIESAHVVAILDAGDLPDQRPYVVMERLHGMDLSEYTRGKTPLALVDVVDYGTQICAGLHELHRRKLAHRDLKPSNVFVVRGQRGSPELKLIDLGLAKPCALSTVASSGATLTQLHCVVGSPYYLAPERFLDDSSVDLRSDIWALGVILFELTTGERPFGGSSIGEIGRRVLSEPPQAPRSPRWDLPPAMLSLIMRCLEKDPARRFQTVAEVAIALLSALEAAQEARPDDGTTRLLVWEAARHRGRSGRAFLAAAVAVSLTAVFVVRLTAPDSGGRPASAGSGAASPEAASAAAPGAGPGLPAPPAGPLQEARSAAPAAPPRDAPADSVSEAAASAAGPAAPGSARTPPARATSRPAVRPAPPPRPAAPPTAGAGTGPLKDPQLNDPN
jgi:serine/threonine-protein kinase